MYVDLMGLYGPPRDGRYGTPAYLLMGDDSSRIWYWYSATRARYAHTRKRQLSTLVVGTVGGAKDEDASGGVGSDA